MNLLEKEAGVNPARARRRVTPYIVFLPDAAYRGNAIERNLEKVKDNVPSRNIFQVKPSIFAASAGSEEI